MKLVSSQLQPVMAGKQVISTVSVPRHGGGFITFSLDRSIVLNRGDSFGLESCKALEASVVPVINPSGEQITWPDGKPATRTQINSVELKFVVKRATGRKIKTHWRYGNLCEQAMPPDVPEPVDPPPYDTIRAP